MLPANLRSHWCRATTPAWEPRQHSVSGCAELQGAVVLCSQASLTQKSGHWPTSVRASRHKHLVSLLKAPVAIHTRLQSGHAQLPVAPGACLQWDRHLCMHHAQCPDELQLVTFLPRSTVSKSLKLTADVAPSMAADAACVFWWESLKRPIPELRCLHQEVCG